MKKLALIILSFIVFSCDRFDPFYLYQAKSTTPGSLVTYSIDNKILCDTLDGGDWSVINDYEKGENLFFSCSDTIVYLRIILTTGEKEGEMITGYGTLTLNYK